MLKGEAGWPGHTRGFEVSVVDLAIWAYLLSQRGTGEKQPLPFRLGMKFYFAALVFSALINSTGSIGFYFVFQVARMYLVFKAVGLAAQKDTNFNFLLNGLALGLVMEIVFVFIQKFVFHAVQPAGTFYHQNILGVINNLLLVILITPLFAHRGNLLRYLAVGSAILIPALIASRATAILGLSAIAVSYLFSVTRNMTSRKATFGVIGVLVVAILVPVAMASFAGRFKDEQWSALNEGSYDERAAYKSAAAAMVADHPLGVGPNYFVLRANTDGYYQRAGVQAALSSLAGHVHNIYYLTTAETGWLGLGSLLFMFFVPLRKGFAAARKMRTSVDGDYIAAITVGLFFCFLHSTYEWMLVLADPEYTVSLVFGLLAALLVKNRGLLASTSPQTANSKVDETYGATQPAVARQRIGF
jgi:O-antigen ligase